MTIEHFDPVGGGLGGRCAREILDDLPEVFQGRVGLAVFVEVLGDAEQGWPRDSAGLVAAVLAVAFLVLAGLLPFVSTSSRTGRRLGLFDLRFGIRRGRISLVRHPARFGRGRDIARERVLEPADARSGRLIGLGA